MKSGPSRINPGTGRLIRHKNKGSKEQLLPSRHAMDQVTKGDPWQRSMSNYAKLTPSGAKGPDKYSTIIDMAELGTKVTR